MSSCMAAGIPFVEVAGVTVYGVYHVAFAISYDSRILGSNVVQDLLQSFHCSDCGLRLLDANVLRAVRMELLMLVVCQGLVGGVSVVPC